MEHSMHFAMGSIHYTTAIKEICVDPHVIATEDGNCGVTSKSFSSMEAENSEADEQSLELP